MPDAEPRPQTILQRVTRMFANRRRVSFEDLAVSETVPVLTVRDRRTGASHDYPLLGEHYRLGRSSENDIVVASEIVSGRHLELSRDRHGGRFQLRDVGSTNGCFWKGRRIQGLELEDGDEISLGPAELETAPLISYRHPPTPAQIWLRRLAIGLAGGGAGLALLVGVVGVSVSVRTLSTVQGPIAAYGSNGEPMQTARSSSHRELLSLDAFSPNLVKALLASEDARFYWHVGIDPYGLLRAVFSNARGGREGASTLTQQIARTLYGDYVGGVEQATLGRKFREAVVALKLEAFHGKDELLRTYLNRVYLGVGYGFEDAAQAYFGKSAKDLSLSEAALLVGLLPSPNGYSPCTNPEAALQQRNGVISRMAGLGFISDADARAARRSGVSIRSEECQQVSRILSPYYYDGMLAELTRLLGSDVVEEGNFAVETSLDPTMQRQAENQLRQFLVDSGPGLGLTQGAIITLDSRNGDVLALVGGYDYAESQFNRATQSRRQPGSTFKLFTYATALEQGIRPEQTWDCGPLVWMGQQFTPAHGCSGALTLDQALAASENTVALRLAQKVGLDAVLATARRFGIGGDLQPVPGMVLGQNEASLLEMTSAYAAVADGGVWHRPRLIRRVFDTDRCTNAQNWQSCRTSYDQAKVPSGDRRAVSADTAAVLTRLFQGVIRSGTGGAAALGRGEGGKTGTTNDGVDSWFIGFIPDRHLVTGIWLGNDDNRPTGSQGAVAAGLWGRYMAAIL